MANKPEQDEYLEQLWYMKEEGKDSVATLKRAMNGAFEAKVIEELSLSGLVSMSQDAAKVSLTEEGETQARYLIRAHRLAERLLHDVLGSEFEPGACEFEHLVSMELVDSICTLLGHPKECPHGLPIPEGECCKRSQATALSFIVPLSSLKLGQSGRIAYVNCRNDQQIHKLEGLCVRPGATIKLHQDYPAYVIECEGANIALDKAVAANICVWKDQQKLGEQREEKSASSNSEVKGWKKIFHRFFK